MSKNKQLVGLSLSFCVQDIASGRVQLEQVEKIIASTAIKDDADLAEVMGIYRQHYWRDFPDKAEEIARQLFAEGKVEQPRLDGGRPTDISQGHWQDADGNYVDV